MDSKERRRRTRVPVHFDVQVAAAGKTLPAETVNISLTGILCSSLPHYHTGDACVVKIRLSEDTVLSMDARILRVDAQQTAISFVSMDEDSFFHLRRLVEYNTRNAAAIEHEIGSKAFE